MRLWLDDLRPAPPTSLWVKSVEEAKAAILRECPTHISFDTDLGENQPTGMDLANWLVNRISDGTVKVPHNFTYSVHSADSVGRADILSFFDSFFNMEGVYPSASDLL